MPPVPQHINPDAAAHSAKNAPTAPDSTDQPRDRTEEPQMVALTTPVTGTADEPVTYTPAELNRLISREIAGRLREVAEFVDASQFPGVVARLELLAARELAGIAPAGKAVA